MSVRRVALLLGVVIGPGAAAAGGPPAARTSAPPPRVGFASIAPSEATVAGDIAAARRDMEERGARPIGPGALREALEAPLPPADAPPPPLGPARELVAQARDAYARFDYTRALEVLEAADQLLLDREPSEPLLELMIERHLLAGLIHEGNGQPEQAMDAFRVVQALDPARAELDPGQFRPNVVALYRQARGAAAPASLRVVIEPAGSRVWIDGHPAGAAPVDAGDLRAGHHWVVASAPGHEPRGELALAAAGERRTVQIELPARPLAARIAELRRALASARSEDELRAGAAELAAASELDVLVLVRTRSGRTEGAAYDARTGQLGGWAPLPSPRLLAQVLPPPAAPAADPLLVRRGDPEPASPAWYRTTWGKGLLIAGGIVAGAVILYAATADGETSYALGDWCFAGEDC